MRDVGDLAGAGSSIGTAAEVRRATHYADRLQPPPRPLASRPGKVFQRETLLREVWNTDWEGSARLVEVHMSNLRRKLAAAGVSTPDIRTVRGVGYRLVV